MKLQELFSELAISQPQTVGNMTMFPLSDTISADRLASWAYTDVGAPRDLYLERDVGYNSLVLGTRAEHVTIVPQGIALITRQAAQDRAVPSTHLVYRDPKQVGAFCVQSSQCGLMSKQRNAEHKLRMLPLAVRYEAFQRRDESADSYSSLWDKLGQWNHRSGVTGDFLVSFFKQYAKNLSLFVAQFELVPQQRGAVVLINGELAGVEVAPNSDYFAGLFQPLIRDCYGAEALLARNEATPQSESLLRDVTSLDELVGAVDELAAGELDFAATVVNDVQSQTVQAKRDHALAGLEVVNMDGAALAGQGVRSTTTNRLIYASLMARPDGEQRKAKIASQQANRDRPARRRGWLW